jgi:(1->4)-alpha-D-glucan 1-alpha-D-glucosylmutase
MSDSQALDRLCAHYGIAAGYEDNQGRKQRTPDGTRRTLLQGMGVAAGNVETERRSLAEALDREWTRILPPAVVVRQDQHALELPLSLPEGGEDRPDRWVLTEENGDTRDDSLDLGGLQIAKQRLIRGQTWLLRHIRVPPPRQLGYHRLELFCETAGAPLAATTLILAPPRCYLPEGVCGERRSWGLATQLYAVRSARNWGIGDFTDLTRLVELTAEAGAGVLAPSPLHALFPGRPEHCDPYQPSSRLFLNVLHIDLEAIPEVVECEELRSEIAQEGFQALFRALRSASLVDYAAVAKTKLDVLARLYQHFREHHLEPGSERVGAFHAFREAQGEPLCRFALFEALAEHLGAAAGAQLPVNDWPEPYRRADSTEVADFAAEHTARIDFFAWLQWQAHQQLQAAGRRSLDLRLALGLCADLAVGAAPDGADVWAERDIYVEGASIGTPPNDSDPEGQDRPVLAWHPVALREAAYGPFIDALRANMRDAGALCIDQIALLDRLYLIPAGMDPDAGTYVAYSFEDLLGVLALESQRSQCQVIGGNPSAAAYATREELVESGILSFGCLYFGRDGDGGFLQPSDFEPQTVVSTSTYDLPTLTGFWRGSDLELRRTLGLFADEREYEAPLLRRSNDRARLLLALGRAGLLPEDHGADPIAVPELTPEHIRAISVYLARTPARLLLIQTFDLLGEED